MSKGNINYKYLKRRKSWFRRNLTLVIFIAVAVIAIAGAVTAGIMLSHYNKEKQDEMCIRDRGNDVWIGGGVKVMPGVTIGNNVVIGGGSVVVKDIPDNSIAVGNPCKVIKKIKSGKAREYNIEEKQI